MTKKERDEIEELVISSMEVLDKSKTNSEYYKDLFSRMSDSQFTSFISKKLPFEFHYVPSVTEPTMDEVKAALDFIEVPLNEKLNMKWVYENKKGEAVQSKECTVIYLTHKKVQQFITKKNKWAIDTANRDMKGGRLIGADKGAITSDREFESMTVQSMDNTIDEFSTFRADSMKSKNLANAVIGTTGVLHLSDITVDKDDFLSKNLMSAYMIGAHLNTNIVNEGNYTPATLRQR